MCGMSQITAHLLHSAPFSCPYATYGNACPRHTRCLNTAAGMQASSARLKGGGMEGMGSAPCTALRRVPTRVEKALQAAVESVSVEWQGLDGLPLQAMCYGLQHPPTAGQWIPSGAK